MDPITGVAALTGLTIAALAGLRLKRQLNEGFEELPAAYDKSVSESQERYNPLTSMINPNSNPVVPVGASSSQAASRQESVNATLGNLDTPYDPNSPEALRIRDFSNRLNLRVDGKGGLYDAINFCRESVRNDTNPYTTYKLDEYGNKTDIILKAGAQKQVDETTLLKFDELCGVCLTSGIDEDGNTFTGRRGMLSDSGLVESALKEQKNFSYPFPRVSPSLGKCEGSPNAPSFAINQETLDMYTKRIECMKSKEIGSKNQCGLCYENDTFTHVPEKLQKNTIQLVLMGVGICNAYVKGVNVKANFYLSTSDPIVVTLLLNQDVMAFDANERRWKQERRLSPASEGDPFQIDIFPDPRKPDEIPVVYGYLGSTNPNGGKFAMPLNLILTRDGITNSSPNKTGGFYQFTDLGLEVARIRPGGQTGRQMQLQGEIPFSFAQASEFSAIDCPSAPFQTKKESVTRFATDQPCYAPGSKPGSYNDACLRERILDVGCSNSGDLYKNPQSLNKGANNKLNTLTDIYNILKDVASNDLIDPVKTKQCSGRSIDSPCDIFRANPSWKFERILNGTDRENANKQPAVKNCLSYLYLNRGASQPGLFGVGATYGGLPLYEHTEQNQNRLFCLPDGELNPNRSSEGLLELSRIYDMGFRGSAGIEGVKKYLTSLLEMAVDDKRNANTDPDRKAAIRKCFGANFNPLQVASPSLANPRVEADPPKYTIQDPNNRTWKVNSDNSIRLNGGTNIEVDFVARADVFKGSEGRVALFINGDPSKAIRHAGFVVWAHPFAANNYDFAWYPLQGPNQTVFFYNDFGGGMFLGYDSPSDRLLIVARNDARRVAWKVNPYPSNFVKNEPSLVDVPRPEANLPTSFTPTYNRQLGTAQNNGDYTLTMTITPSRNNTNNWSELVHFTTTGEDCCAAGTRIPGIWFIPNTNRLHVRIGDSTDGNWGADTATACNVNQANTFSLECRGSSVTLKLNSETIRLTQPSRRATGLAQVWSSTRFYPAATASISNFKFTGLN